MQSLVIGPDDGESWWQPQPSGGYVNTYITPENNPYHDFSSGLIYITQGSGIIKINGEPHNVGKGCTVLFAHNDIHIIDNTGDIDMHMFWVFLPPKLEEWFRAIGKPRIPGETEPPKFARPPHTDEAMKIQKFVKS